MVFHHEHMHGRAFHGLEARQLMELERRDSHGDKIKLNIPADDNKHRFIHLGGQVNNNKDTFIHNAGKAADNNAVETVYSQVYVTASKTFNGPAVYVTETNGTPITTPATVSYNSYESAKSLHHQTQTQNAYESAKSVAHQPQIRSSTSSSLQTTPPQFTRSSAVGDGVVGGTPLSASRGPTVVGGTPLSATRSSGPELIAQKQHGMTSGAKAGLALGILAIIGICAGAVLFCLRRRKKQLQQQGEKLDEKHASQNSFFSGTAAAFGAPAGEKRESAASNRTASTAPRLSLRPVTQFLPSFGDNNKSTGNNLSVPAMSEKPRSGPQNPFSDAAVLSEKQARPESPPSNPFEDGDAKRSNTPSHSAQNSYGGSDAGTPQLGTAAAVPVAAAGATPARGPNNVHRVQLDFKPSMDDELELKSGQLVRMLHEYDDGWALCIRMDRSQQGVCPRTCLSKLPVKPRPQGPTPNGPQGRPQGPAPQGFRGPPPQGPNMMMPRPLTPTGRERSNTAGGRTSPSPQEGSRTRSQSVSAVDRPVSPIDSSMPARKPVPGQAM